MSVRDRLENEGYIVRAIDYNEIEVDAPADKVREILTTYDLTFLEVKSAGFGRKKTRIKERVVGALDGNNQS